MYELKKHSLQMLSLGAIALAAGILVFAFMYVASKGIYPTVSLEVAGAVSVLIAALLAAASVPLIQTYIFHGRILDRIFGTPAAELEAEIERHKKDMADEVSERMQAQAELRRAEVQLRDLAAGSIQGIVVTDKRWRPIFVNNAAVNIFGFNNSEELLETKDFTSLFAPEERDRTRRLINRNLAQGINVIELQSLTKNSGNIWLEALPKLVVWEGLPAYQITLTDITERRVAESKAASLINYDELTGLPTRRIAIDRMQTAFAAARRTDELVTVLYVDLDDFSPLTTRHGEDAGDHILKTLSSRLTSWVREADTVARVDETGFLIIAPGMQSEEAATPVAKKILAALGEPVAMNGVDIGIGASVGVSVFPKHADSPEAAIIKAKQALRAAKKACKNNLAFSPSPDTKEGGADTISVVTPESANRLFGVQRTRLRTAIPMKDTGPGYRISPAA